MCVGNLGGGIESGQRGREDSPIFSIDGTGEIRTRGGIISGDGHALEMVQVYCPKHSLFYPDILT